MLSAEIEMVPRDQAALVLERVGEEAWHNWHPAGVAPIKTPLNSLARRQISAILDPKANFTITTEKVKDFFNDNWETFLFLSVVGSAGFLMYRTWNDLSGANEDWGRLGTKLAATAAAGVGGSLIGAVGSLVVMMAIEPVVEKLETLEKSVRKHFS
ncbi:MAG: hypothetical protein HYW45_03725 [Candidatus Daviesbacteria bacterium]|nr:MAG: hypothetical protein HYW45_03725 [Candidatus Daviesbacteria bacterium]